MLSLDNIQIHLAPLHAVGYLINCKMACRGWITLSKLTNDLKNQNLAQTYHMDVLNGTSPIPPAE